MHHDTHALEDGVSVQHGVGPVDFVVPLAPNQHDGDVWPVSPDQGQPLSRLCQIREHLSSECCPPW